MKRLLISLLAAALVPAFAQTANPGAKVDPKNNKVSKPVVEKPKVKLMTRDELRACLNRNDENVKEAESIKTGQAAYKENAAALQKEKAELQTEDEKLSSEGTVLKAERDAIIKSFEDLKVASAKMSKEDKEAAQKAYQDRAKTFETNAIAIQERAKASATKRTEFGAKVDALNASFKALEEKTEAHFDKKDSYKAECMNKPYDEADELALKKERAAAGK